MAREEKKGVEIGHNRQQDRGTVSYASTSLMLKRDVQKTVEKRAGERT